MNILKFSIPEVFFGRESIKYTGTCARRLGGEKIFFVSDPGLEKTGWIDMVFEILDLENIKYMYYSNVDSNPKDWQIKEGAKLYREEKCDIVIALGGGSPMDAAKGIALVVSNGGDVHDYEGANRIKLPLPPMIFIPSTASSGADISQFAIITDVKRNVKMSIISRTLVPNISIIDPVLLTTKTEELIIAAALDALTHAIEAYVSLIAMPFTETQSLQAIELILKNLVPAVETRSLDHLEQLSIAGTFSAMAFSNASLGMDHALAHSIGGINDVAHGLIHPILLPHVMEYNLPACEEKIADIGKIILGKSMGNSKATAEAGIEKLEQFFHLFKVSTRLRDILPNASVLPRICKMAVKDSCLLSNPRSATEKDMMKICKKAW
ncbi:MAG: iron-containing alcohol dehydrogenase [Thermodesulfobacteriota bacterium]|nr:iron-containing alcohol dehydrogenase [Thermodesulfobacteriota bacterium]